MGRYWGGGVFGGRDYRVVCLWFLIGWGGGGLVGNLFGI